MAYTAYRVLKAPIDQIERFMAEAIADGWQPLGSPILLFPSDKDIYQALVQGTPDGGSSGPVTIVVEDISDATDTGKAVLLAGDEAAARAAIGAGTSNLALGSGASEAAAGNHVHGIAGITGLQAALDAKASAQALTDLTARVEALETV